ncbi:WG containing repeat-containing protein [Chryseolinea serpens]|uniref:WG containing repeat-containing protein n=2 Tax=Chryseolinea serpens TaxID=947013 RepID=A0A1M5XAG2_9BACT|nr:WG containing repeat-containing protein [Chryseolinea serpens]
MHPEDQNRFRIVDGDRIGFINTFGEVVIAPVFRNANTFSEGLCAARKNGLFGFIDVQGNFVIPPQFDFATQFNEGFAIAFKNGKSFYIDRNGNSPFHNPFQTIRAFQNGRAYVTTYSEKMGVINIKGELLIDTVFSQIDKMIDHRAIVRACRMIPV